MATAVQSSHAANSMAIEVEQTPFAVSLVMIAFLSIGLSNAFELLVLVLTTFKRYRGLYFWSVLAAAGGIPVYCIGFTLKFFVTSVPNMNYIGMALVIVGWVPMVTGQSLALYSRLNLVMNDPRKLRWVLCMIIFNAFIFHGATTGLVFAAESSARIASIYSAYEKAELMAFAVQEMTISSLYIYETWRLLHPTSPAQGRRIAAVRRNLICVNVVVIVLDAALIGIEMANQYKIQTSLKAFVYSVKLGLEFSVLNTLRRALRGHTGSSYGYEDADDEFNHTNNSYSAQRNRDRDRRHRNRSTTDNVFRGGMQHAHKAAIALPPATVSTISSKCRRNTAPIDWELDDINIVKTTEVYMDSSMSVGPEADVTSAQGRSGSSTASSEINLTLADKAYRSRSDSGDSSV